MALYTRNIVIDVGSDFEYIFPSIKNSDNSVLNLSGYTFSSKLKKDPRSFSTSATFNVSIANTAQGKIKLSLGSSVTSSLIPGRYCYDILINSGQKVTRAFEGNALITPGVTTSF